MASAGRRTKITGSTMKTPAGFVIVAITVLAQVVGFAAPTPPPSASTAAPPAGGYGYLTKTSDNVGAYRLDINLVTGPSERFKHPVYWVRVSRFVKAGDENSAYPTEYFLLKIDCPSQTYMLAAKYDVDREGKDIGPRPHIFTDPVHKKLPNSKGGPRINFYNSPPELVAAAQLQDACFPGD